MHQTNASAVQPRAGQATALLVIDVQQGLFRKSTPIFRSELLLDVITTLVERAGAAGKRTGGRHRRVGCRVAAATRAWHLPRRGED